MLVTREHFNEVLEHLASRSKLSVDVETTGIRVFHGDHIFSVIFGDNLGEYYFNFQNYGETPNDKVLGPEHFKMLQEKVFSDPNKTLFGHNFKFDMAMLTKEGVDIKGKTWCTMAQARVIYNDHMQYSLAKCTERIGLKKSNAVEEYVVSHKLTSWEIIPGKTQRKRLKFFHQVPLEIIQPYAEQDANVTYRLGKSQEEAIEKLDSEGPIPSIKKIIENECRLTKTLFKMEQVGLKIDRPYCIRAAYYEESQGLNSASEFKTLTGKDYSASPKLFAEVFKDQKELWSYTDLGNPSFDSEALAKFKSPVATQVLKIRDSKSKADFYRGFLYHADSKDIVHPHFNQGGTNSGRISSSDPNFQNLTSKEDPSLEFIVRRAIIPHPDFCFYMPDYKQMEMKLMLEMAARLKGYETRLVSLVKGGMDCYKATAQLMVEKYGKDIGREKAKAGNLAKIYGSGIRTLSVTLGCTYNEAEAVFDALDAAAPEIEEFCARVRTTAEVRGFVFNWAARRSYFPNSRLSYRAPNRVIQGGAADVVKIAMNEIDEVLTTKGFKSRMVLQTHDELAVECHKSEVNIVPKIVTDIMENTFPYKYLKLDTSSEYSWKSMGDKQEGFPV